MYVIRIALLILGLTVVDYAAAAGRVFYDGFESGNTSLWQQDDSRNRCRVVTAAVDGVTGAYAGSRFAACNWNGTQTWDSPGAFETLKLVLNNLGGYNDEVFVRVRLRADQNLARSSGAPAKLLRWYIATPDTMCNWSTAPGINGGWYNDNYWGDDPGDTSAGTAAWHMVELYYNTATGNLKQWNDDQLVVNGTGTFNSRLNDFYLASNFSDLNDGKIPGGTSDALNTGYFDEFEIYTDKASGATGSMSAGTITTSGPPAVLAPTGVTVE